jgi:hypothetical protein
MKMILATTALLAAAWFVAPASAAAQQVPERQHDRPVPETTAARATSSIQIDGRLEDEAWAAAEVITELRQREPDEGSPVSQPTEVRILYTDEALYVGAWLAGPVTYRLGRRDMPTLDSDWFGVTLDSHHDHRTGYRFQVNPGGVQRDGTIGMEGGTEREDLSWDAVWEVATTVSAEGWTVEMRIPFSQLRFSAEAVQTWGLQLVRIIGPRQETAHWSFQPRGQPGGVPTYGHLAGLEGVRPGRRLEALPFVVGRAEHVDRGGNPFRSDRELGMSAGVDLLYRLTSHVTVNAAINPDFGQVEVDPAVVNLGVYETFFPERRPFFVEGSEIFQFTGNTSGGDLFYSRRIGRRPQVPPPGAPADIPDFTPILGAAKLTGRTPDGWSLGVMNAVTGRATGRYLADGEEQSTAVEPLTNYFVTRFRRDISAGRTSLGGIVTAVNRDLSTPRLESVLHHGAYSGGMDFRHEWADRVWAVQGSVAGSHVTGSASALTRTQRMPHHYFQRPDADHLRVDSAATSLTGYSAGARLAKQSGQHWTGSLAAAVTAPSFEVNDMGFQSRTDRRDLAGVLTYSQREPGRVLRDWAATTFLRHETNFDGDVVQSTRVAQLTARTLEHWTGGLLFQHRGRALDDRSTRGGPMMVRSGELVYGFTLNTDGRRPVVAGINAVRADFQEGDGGYEAGVNLQVRTSPRWNLSIQPRYASVRIPAQYLATVPDASATETFGARYIFAPLHYTELNTSIRLNVAIQPRLTLEVFAQPLIAGLDFHEPMTLAAPRTFDFERYDGPIPSLDHTLRSLRGNALLRWEWRPGSTVYLAWQQTRLGAGETGQFSLLDDTRSLFQTPPDNILVLKVNYWLNP